MSNNAEQIINLGSVWEPSDFKELSEDVVKLTDRELRRHAAEDAESGNPPLDQKTQFGVQALIMDHVSEKCDRLVDFFNSGAMAAARELRDLQIDEISSNKEQNDHKLDALKEGMNGAYERAKNDLSADLLQANKDSLQALTSLRRFKSDHELIHEANYPDSTLFVKATIIVALLFEAVFNAFLFQNVMPGYLAGAAIALIFSGLNIALGFIAGWAGWRNIIHIKSVRKLIGWLITGITTVVGMGWNLFVAHFRELAAVAETGAYKQAASHMFENPLAINSIEAYALLLVGILIFFLIAYEGYCRLDDPYIRYGKVTRTSRAQRKKLEKLRQLLRKNIEVIANASREGIQNQIDHEANNVIRAKATIDALKKFKSDISNSISRQVMIATKKLRAYREANMKVRGGKLPVSFANYPEATDQIHAGMPSEEEAYELVKLINRHGNQNKPILETYLAAITKYEADLLRQAEIWFGDIENQAEEEKGQGENNDQNTVNGEMLENPKDKQGEIRHEPT